MNEVREQIVVIRRYNGEFLWLAIAGMALLLLMSMDTKCQVRITIGDNAPQTQPAGTK